MSADGIPIGGWRFRTIVLESGRDPVRDWLKKLPVGVRDGVWDELEAILRNHRALPINMWGRPQFGPLSDGIYEFIFKVAGVQYRPLGYFGPGKGVFTFLVGATKARKRKGKVQWTPEDAPSLAIARKKLISEGGCGTNELEII